MGNIDFIGLSGMGENNFSRGAFIATIAVIIAFSLALYLLRSFGLYALAKRQGLKGKRLAFVPLLWVYVMAKLIGKAYFFGKEFKAFAVLVTIIFALAEVLSLTVTFLAYFPLVGYYFSGGDIAISLVEGVTLNTAMKQYPLVSGVFVRAIGDNAFHMPYNNVITVINIMNAFNIVSGILTFVYSLATVFIYIFLFRKYWPREAVLGVVLCILIEPAFPIIIFCLRKKEPMTREEYLRSIGVVNPYGPYYNPGTTNPNATTKKSEDINPFGDFPDKNKPNDDPFSEFDKKD